MTSIPLPFPAMMRDARSLATNGCLALLLLTAGAPLASAADPYPFGDVVTPFLTFPFDRVAVGDVDGDGFVDVWGRDPYDPQYLQLEYGDGSGVFRYQSTSGGGSGYPAGNPFGYPAQIALVDLNNDGLADPVQISGDQLGWSFRQTDRTYLPGTPAAGFTFSGLSKIAIADFSGDHLPDIVTASNAGLTVVVNQGGGTFALGNSYAGVTATTLNAGDFDGDGKADLLVSAADGLEFWKGDGAGGFATPVLSISAQDYTFTELATGDLNGDGKLDLAWTSGTKVYTALNQGGGSFTITGTELGYNLRSDLRIADFNQDGFGDIFGIADGTVMVVLYSNGDGTLREPVAKLFSTFYVNTLHDTAIADVNNDGLPDLVAVSTDNYYVFGFLNHFWVLTFLPIPTQQQEVPYLPNATTNAPGPITYAVVSGNASIVGNTVQFSGSGSVTIKATVAADADHIETSVTRTFQVEPTPAKPGNFANSAGQFRFDGSTAIAPPAAGTLAVTVTRVGGTTGAVSVHYATVDGTALAGRDYTVTSGTLTFADRQALGTITIPIASTATAGHAFTLQLSNPVGGAEIYAPGTLTVTIGDAPSAYQQAATAAYAQTGAYFAVGDQANGYFCYAYYRYYLYLENGTQADLNAYYQNMAYGYYLAYMSAGQPDAALAWYRYLTGFI